MRIRSIKPEFWSSDDVTALAIEDRLLFIGLWSYVDDNGVGRDEEHLIVSALFPRDMFENPRETVARLSRGLSNLFTAGLIHRYEVDGRRYLEVTNWDKHQRIDKPNKPRFPHYDASRDTLATPSREFREIPAPGTEEQGNKGTEDQGAGERSSSAAHAKPKRRGTETPLPEDWQPTDAHRKRAAELGVDVDYEATQFRAHAEAHDRRCVVWNAAFTQWLGKARPRPKALAPVMDFPEGTDWQAVADELWTPTDYRGAAS